jgi:hypothetical protein
MTAKGPKPTPVNRAAVRRVAGAEARKGGGQYGADTFAAHIDSVYQRKGGGRHVPPTTKGKKP